MHWTDCSLTMPRLLMLVRNGSVFWERTHCNERVFSNFGLV